MVNINFNAKLPAVVFKKGKYYIAVCPLFDVITQGETSKKAKENLSEALSLFLISCFERGTLDEVLKESGFKTVVSKKNVKSSKSRIRSLVDVPIPFYVNETALSIASDHSH